MNVQDLLERLRDVRQGASEYLQGGSPMDAVVGNTVGPVADVWQSNKPLQEKLLRTGGAAAEVLAKPLAMAATYSPEAEAAKFPWLSKRQIDALRNRYAYGMNPDKGKAVLAKVRPSEFVAATSPNEYTTAQLVDQAGRFDPYRFAATDTPDLMLTEKMGTLREHEGRHRMLGYAASSGSDEPLPVVMRSAYDQGAMSDELKKIGNRKVQGQKFDRFKGRGKNLKIGDVEPITYGNANLDSMEHHVNVPLKDVGIALKPEGPGFTEADMLAYLRRPIPFGKIPPPIPRVPE